MGWRVLLALSFAVLTTANCDDSRSPTSPPLIGTSRASGPGSTGGSTNPTPTPAPTPGSSTTGVICLANRGTISAQIDGTPWTATCLQAASWTANTLMIVATNATQAITLGAVTPVPRSIDLRVGAAFASVTLLSTAATWTTANSGGSGTLTLSRLDTQGAVGTFSFSAPAASGTVATGTKVVANGVFNLTF
jgi:hypothetical protein